MGLALRLLWAAVNPHVLVWDEVPYHTLAVRLATGEQYGLPFWPPGYPILIGFFYRLFGPHVPVAIAVNLVASVGTIPLVGLLTREYFGERAARLSLWATALMPSYILAVVLLRYEVWTQFGIVLGLWLALQARWTWPRVLGQGAIMALLGLIRPLWLGLPALFWLCR